MAAGAFFEEDISWEIMDANHVKGTLKKHGQEVSAMLTFSDERMLENFGSSHWSDIDDKGKMGKYTSVNAYEFLR
jgi:hypothetical protein